MAARK